MTPKLKGGGGHIQSQGCQTPVISLCPKTEIFFKIMARPSE